MILVDLERVSAARPGRPLFTDLSLTLQTGDRLGVVGLNGTGKSTLLRVLAGLAEPEQGTVRTGRDVRIGFLEQRPELPPGTVRQAVGEQWEAAAVLEHLGMGGPMHDADVATLSGGQAKRVALARLLVTESDLLILDEPTNHLDIEAIAWLEDRLARHRGGLVLVTHDRHVLDRVTTRVLELDRGAGYVHEGGYGAYLEGRALREEHAAKAEQTRKNLARRELAWLRRGAPARSTKPKARIASATAIVTARADAPARAGELTMSMGSQRLGSKGVELRDVSFAWPNGAEVLKPVSLALEPGDRIGIVGPNGAGKTTLLDLVAGRLAPTTGSVERGATVRIGYHDQLGRDHDPEQRVREAVAGDKGQPSLEDVTLMKRFWFDGDAQFAPIRLLSGGERRRLQLLLTLVEQPNVLLLDEPTNDLDLDTLRALEDLLEDWPGIVVAVSHDRAFLDRVADQLLALDDEGGVRLVRGGVAGWMAERAAATPAATAASARVRTAAASSPTVAEKPKRSASTLRRLLTDAEKALAKATKRRDALAAEITGVSDHVQLTELGARLTDAQNAVDAAEHTWLELAEEAE